MQGSSSWYQLKKYVATRSLLLSHSTTTSSKSIFPRPVSTFNHHQHRQSQPQPQRRYTLPIQPPRPPLHPTRASPEPTRRIHLPHYDYYIHPSDVTRISIMAQPTHPRRNPHADSPVPTIPGHKAGGDLARILRREVAELLGRSLMSFPGELETNPRVRVGVAHIYPV